MFQRFDGTSRVPRPLQVRAIAWMKANWNSKVLAMNLPTGVGKSALLRSIQLEFPRTVGITPSNILLDQYRTTYADLNYLKGIERYTCIEDNEYSCNDMKEMLKPPCKDCPYKECRERAQTESTIFNPISYYYFTKIKDYEKPDILVVDEAHKLIDTLMLLVDISFRKGRYEYPDIDNEVQLLEWLESVQSKLYELLKKYRKAGNAKKVKDTIQQRDRLNFLTTSFRKNPQDFVFYEKEITFRKQTDKYLIIKPVKPPKWLLDQLFDGFKKVVLMSATLLESDVRKLNFFDFKYVDMNSPIPKENRAVRYIPHTAKMNFQTSPSDVAKYINRILDLYPGENTVVHLSYGWAEKVRAFFPNALFNTPETKEKILEHFKKVGGVWIASGCSEGLDLPEEECRLTIIPFVMLANIKDPVVIKQLSLPNGRTDYELNALKTVIQQAGRGTRSESDYSVTVIGDNKFPNLVLKNINLLPISFKEAIVWSTNAKS